VKTIVIIIMVLWGMVHGLPGEDIVIIPAPSMVQQREGVMEIDGPLSSREWFGQECAVLERETENMTQSLSMEGSRWGSPRITYASLESGPNWRIRWVCNRHDIEYPEGEESYALHVTPDEIVAVGADDRGLFYALQTLKQLVRKEGDSFVIPCLTIYDTPALGFRGIHFFTGNEALEEQKKLIDFMAEHKMNHAIIQVDYMEFDRYPEIRYEPYAQSQEEIRELIEYAEERFITVTPLVASLGHAEWAFTHDENLDIAEDPDNPVALNVTNPRTFKFLFNIFDEVIELFDPEFFHVGLDEIDHFADFPASEESKKYSITEIMDMYMREVGEYFYRQDIDRIMLWGDMFLAPGEAPDAAFAETARAAKARRAIISNAMRRNRPDEIIVTDWHYQPVDPEHYISLDIFHELGTRTIASTWYNPQNIRNFARQAIADESWGLLQTTWAGFNFYIEENVDSHPQFEAYLLAADYGWSGREEKATELPYDYSSEFWKRWYAPSVFGGARVSQDDVSFPVLKTLMERGVKIDITPEIDYTKRPDEITYEVKISLSNPLDNSLSVMMEEDVFLSVSEELHLSSFEKKELSMSFTLPVEKVSPQKDIPITFEFVLEDKEPIEIVKDLHPTPVWGAVSLENPIEINADLAGWENVEPYTFADEKFVKQKEEWSPEDLNVRMYAGYYDTDLYLAFEVEDDVHFNDYESYNIWQGDSVQIGFDFLYHRDPFYTGDDLEIGFALDNEGEKKRVTWVPHVEVQDGPGAEVDFAIRREDNYTIYEIMFPLDTHELDEVQVRDKFGFTFAVNDNDGEGFAGGIVGSRGIYDPKNPSRFGTLYFMD